jgi:TRAP-type C4-dicarboxylate transport system permease small subunit
MMDTTPDTPPRPLDRLAAAVNAIGAIALAAVAAVQAWQVIARYGFNDSPSWTEPVSAVLLCTAMSCGAAVMVHRQAHFGFGLLRDAAPPALRRALEVTSDAIVGSLGLLLAGGAAVLAADGWDVSLAGVALPQGAPFVPLAFGGLLLAVFAFAAAAARLRRGAPR